MILLYFKYCKLNLFKRLLLSFFPQEIQNNMINPANMLVSFISTKDFFSIIIKKISQNYKMNWLDINLESSEVKSLFGDTTITGKKNIEKYFSYITTANLNGFRFFNISNVWYALSFVSILLSKDIFNNSNKKSMMSLSFSSYLILYLFAAKIKVFPYKTDAENYNWFVDLFFNFYNFIYAINTVDKQIEDHHSFKKQILWDTDIVRMFFYICKQYQSYFSDAQKDTDKYNFFRYLIDNDKLINEYLPKYDKTSISSIIYKEEKIILSEIFPNDMMNKHILKDIDVVLFKKNIVSKIYDESEITKLIKKLDKKDGLEKFVFYITKPGNFKENFFNATRKYVSEYFQTTDTQEDMNEIEEILSEIWENTEDLNLDKIKIPERLKKESKIMEWFLNFYIWFLGWLSIARWDSNYIKLFQKDLLEKISNKIWISVHDPANKSIIGNYNHLYAQNSFQYKTIYENLKKGKNKFKVQTPSDIWAKNINYYIINQYQQNSLCNLIQEIQVQDTKLYINDHTVNHIFKKLLYPNIKSLINLDNNSIVQSMYSKIFWILDENKAKEILEEISKNMNNENIKHMKNHLYTLNFRISHDFMEKLCTLNMNKDISDWNLVIITSNIKETIMWFLILQKYLIQSKQINKTTIKLLYSLYMDYILLIPQKYKSKVINITNEILEKYSDILEHYIKLDDNKSLLSILVKNLKDLQTQWTIENSLKNVIISEDVLWFYWMLKHINYYNKRFVIPN